MKLLKIGVGLAIAVGIGIQFIPVKGVGENPTQRYEIKDAPPEVLAILKESCFDCHSNETRWPFYARLAPSSWLMVRDVRIGRGRMNFSEWGDVDEAARTVDKESAWDEIEEGEMPPWFYIPMHPSARLDDKEKALLKEWLLKKPAVGTEQAKEEGAKPATPPTEAPK